MRRKFALIAALVVLVAGTVGIAPTAAGAADPGDELTITIPDLYLDVDYNETFVVVMEGTHGIVLVEKAAYDAYDAVSDEYVFPNPAGCEGTEHRISTAQLMYVLSEFDATVYPTVGQAVGEPLPRGAEGQKVWILIHNIRDEWYHYCTATSYVDAYFSASEDAAYNRNMIHVDSYDWANRLGPDATRPYFYEQALAREFEHLVHFDMDADEEAWVEEGLAELAAFLCGYGHPSERIAYYFVYHPTVSLTVWSDGTENHGASYLFALYLYEHYGGAAFVSALAQEQANGIEGVEATLAALGHKETFDEVFDDWTIANYVDDTRKAKGRYGYETLDIGSVDTWGYTIEYVLSGFWGWPPDVVPPLEVSSDWFFGIEPGPYTAHYFRVTNEVAVEVLLDGDDYAGTPAYSGSYEWYSDAEAWAWHSFYQTFTVPAAGATLSFRTFYEIEEDWDYGYVEVYDQDTGEWYTLDASGTVDYIAHTQDNPNVPAGREPSAYEAAGRWHAFTGSSGGWVPISMDLTPFAGHDIDLYFTTWQDGHVTMEMMYVDDISIPEIGFFDDVEAGEDGWVSTGWYVTDGIWPNGLGLTAFDTKGIPSERYPSPSGNKGMPLLSIKSMDVDESTQSGALHIGNTPANSGRVRVFIVSNRTSHMMPMHYELTIE